MASDAGYAGEMNVHSWGDDFNALEFVIDQFVSQHAHVTWATVQAVHGGGLSLPATVDVQPMANMLNGQDQPTPHGILYGLPTVRIQGGANAIICDPVAGDIGLVMFADRDMSSVKATRAVANPGSRRRFDMADGVYIGGILNSAPTQYIEFLSGLVKLVAPVVSTSQVFQAGNGATGTFTSQDGKTITVSHGIITSIV